jgi:hypothetical protein
MPRPEPSTGAAASCPFSVIQRVLAEADEDEVVLLDPTQELRGLRHLVARDRRRRRRQLGQHAPEALAHRPPVGDRGAHVVEHQLDLVADRGQDRGIGAPIDLDQHDRLARDRRRRLGRRLELDHLALVVAAHRDHRVEDEMDREPAPVERHAHRVDQERHVVVDDLDHRVGRLPAVLLERRVVDPHLGLAVGTRAGESPQPERRAVEVHRPALGEIFRRQPAQQLAGEGDGEGGFGRGKLALEPLEDLADALVFQGGGVLEGQAGSSEGPKP